MSPKEKVNEKKQEEQSDPAQEIPANAEEEGPNAENINEENREDGDVEVRENPGTPSPIGTPEVNSSDLRDFILLEDVYHGKKTLMQYLLAERFTIPIRRPYVFTFLNMSGKFLDIDEYFLREMIGIWVGDILRLGALKPDAIFIENDGEAQSMYIRDKCWVSFSCPSSYITKRLRAITVPQSDPILMRQFNIRHFQEQKNKYVTLQRDVRPAEIIWQELARAAVLESKRKFGNDWLIHEEAFIIHRAIRVNGIFIEEIDPVDLCADGEFECYAEFVAEMNLKGDRHDEIFHDLLSEDQWVLDSQPW